jgi:hypothetical protein
MKASVLMTILLLIAFPMMAQPGDPSSDPDVVPITGIEILISIGAFLGIRKLIIDKRKETS